MNIFDTLVVQPLLNILMALYSIIPGGDFGVAVIIFTIIVRLTLWPLVKKQLHQVKAMKKMQPELDKIKKKAKGNKQLQGMMMLELYKEYKINPFRSILILLIQLPILIGLYHVIVIFTQHRDKLAQYTYDFIENIPAVQNLISNPDIFNQNLFGIVDLTRRAIDQYGISPFLLVLAIGAGFLQYVASKQTMPQAETKRKLREVLAEASEGKEADQTEINAIMMQKMVKIMPLFMVMIMINLPGALSLYYGVSTFVAVIQQHILLKRDEEEMVDIVNKKQSPKKNHIQELEKNSKELEVVKNSKPSNIKKKSKKSSKSKVKATVRVVEKGGKK